MYKRILLAYDGSEAGQKALLECRELAQWSQCEIELVAVMPSMMAFCTRSQYSATARAASSLPGIG